MKTTLNLDDGLVRDVKQLAAEQGITMTSLVERALRDALDRAAEPVAYVVDFPVVAGVGVPDVDVSDRTELYERLDGRR